jgi:hypothetical protein
VTVPRALLLALALLQAAGVFDAVKRATCEEECRRSGCDDCTPDHDAPQCSCHCPSLSAGTASRVVSVTLVPAAHLTDVSFARTDQRYPNPDPREILRVPRAHVV